MVHDGSNQEMLDLFKFPAMHNKKPRKRCCENAKVLNHLRLMNSNAHLLQILRDLKRRLCLAPDLFNGHALCVLLQCQSLQSVAVKHSEICDDCADTLLARQWERALIQNLGVALLIDVLHGDDDLRLCRVGDEIHCAADALDFSGKHEVC